MRKIRTLFKKNEKHLATRDLNVDWANKEWKAYRKYDGTSCAVINGVLYKRYDCKLVRPKKGSADEPYYKTPPEGAIACCDPDPITGHWPHWIIVKATDKWHLEAEIPKQDGTYELVGPKINGNKDHFEKHIYVDHNSESIIVEIESLDYDYLHEFMKTHDMEGLVIKYEEDWVKVRKCDFGLEW